MKKLVVAGLMVSVCILSFNAAAEENKNPLSNLKIAGYTQFSYTDDPALGGKEPFGVKTARIGFNWKLNEWSEFKIQPDFYTAASSVSTSTVSNTSVVTSAPVLTFKEIWGELIADKDMLRLKFGQYLIPFSFEVNYSTAKKKVFDTPQFISKVMTAQYDYGIQLIGNLPGEALKDTLSWRFALLNGSTYGTETDNKKDFSGFLVSKIIKDIEFGASIYTRYISSGDRYETHYGLYGKYETEGSFPVFFTLEYAGGKDSAGSKDTLDLIATLEIKTLALLSDRLSCIAPVIRYEGWDSNIWDGSYVSYYTAGINVYMDKTVRFLMDYVVKDDGIPNNNKLNFMLQFCY